MPYEANISKIGLQTYKMSNQIISNKSYWILVLDETISISG